MLLASQSQCIASAVEYWVGQSPNTQKFSAAISELERQAFVHGLVHGTRDYVTWDRGATRLLEGLHALL